MIFTNNELESVQACPCCSSNLDLESQYISTDGYKVYQCKNCKLFFCEKRLNFIGKKKYWDNYYSKIHQINSEYNEKRHQMYKIDYNYIKNFLKKGSTILDVGCAGGQFLDFFAQDGFNCFGTEYGLEAAQKANEKYHTYYGDFSQIAIKKKFDLIIFRGVLQYVYNVKEYIKKASLLLKKNGLIYVTAQPNGDSFCHKLYKKNFIFSPSISEPTLYTPETLRFLFNLYNFYSVGEIYFYTETPYALIENDIKEIYNKISIDGYQNKNPPFFGNMTTIIFKK